MNRFALSAAVLAAAVLLSGAVQALAVVQYDNMANGDQSEIQPEFYWTVVVALCGAGWAVVSTMRDRKKQNLEHSRAIAGRLLEADKVIIDHPEIQKYLSATALEDEDYFRKTERLEDEQFFKAKSYLYSQLNLFDEILSAAAQARDSFFLLRPPEIFDLEDWEQYIMHKLTHPLCRSILAIESPIFGRTLQGFWRSHKSAIASKSPDRFSW